MIVSDQRFKKGKPLEDNYPIFNDYLYMVNDKIIQSEISGTVTDLKRYLINRGYSVDEICSVEWNWQ